MSNFSYYGLNLRLRNPMLGTNPSSADVLHDHVIEKSRKQIAEANRGQKKVLKTLKKFVGTEISADKEIEELTGVIRGQQELLGVREEIPTEINAIIAYSEQLDERLSEKFEGQDLYKSTVFIRGEDGNPAISTHMVLGCMKSIISTLVNSQKPDEKKTGIFKSKVQMSESLSMDCKFVETVVPASEDIERDPVTKERKLCVRPIRFNRLGVQTVALAASEVLPAGTIFSMTMRIRKGSPLDSMEILDTIFSYGKSLGLGSWRGSNNYGQFDYQLTQLNDYVEEVQDSDLGWK